MSVEEMIMDIRHFMIKQNHVGNTKGRNITTRLIFTFSPLLIDLTQTHLELLITF